MKYREYWLEVKNNKIFEEPVDGLDADAVHVVEYCAVETLQNKISFLSKILSEMTRVEFDSGDSLHELERRALIAQEALKELAHVKVK